MGAIPEVSQSTVTQNTLTLPRNVMSEMYFTGQAPSDMWPPKRTSYLLIILMHMI